MKTFFMSSLGVEVVTYRFQTPVLILHTHSHRGGAKCMEAP